MAPFRTQTMTQVSNLSISTPKKQILSQSLTILRQPVMESSQACTKEKVTLNHKLTMFLRITRSLEAMSTVQQIIREHSKNCKILKKNHSFQAKTTSSYNSSAFTCIKTSRNIHLMFRNRNLSTSKRSTRICKGKVWTSYRGDLTIMNSDNLL